MHLHIPAININRELETQLKTAEEQESKCTGLYNKALELTTYNPSSQEAVDCLLELLKEPILSESTAKKMKTLQFLSFKNLGELFEAQDQISKALEYFSKSVSLRPDNPILWYKIGTLALKKDPNYSLARHAFERALLIDPSHWLSLNNLINVLLAVGDQQGCSALLEKALQKYPTWNGAKRIREELEASRTGKRKREFEKESFSKRFKIDSKHVVLDELSWLALGNLIQSIFLGCTTPGNEKSIFTGVNIEFSGKMNFDLLRPFFLENENSLSFAFWIFLPFFSCSSFYLLLLL